MNMNRIGLAAMSAAWLVAVSANAGTLRVGGTKWWFGERDGSMLKPFATLDAARDAVRIARQSGDMSTWTIKISGTVHLVEPFVLDSRDHDLVFCGEDDAAIIGAKLLTGWQETADGAWETDIPRSGGEREWFCTLWSGKDRLVRARYPNQGYMNVVKIDQIVVTNVVGKKKSIEATHRVTLKPEAVAVLANLSPEVLAAAEFGCGHFWNCDHRPIVGFEEESGVVVTKGHPFPSYNNWKPSSNYFIENVPAAMDAPGEWLYDVVGSKIRYLPREGEKIGETEIFYAVPGLEHLVEFRGDIKRGQFVNRIRFERVAFGYSDSPHPGTVSGAQAAAWAAGAIDAIGAHECSFVDCSVMHTGEYAVWFQHGCASNSMERCVFSDLGAGGVKIGVFGNGNHSPVRGRRHVVRENLLPVDTFANVIDNCLFENGGLRYPEGIGVIIGHSPFNSVTHCEIRDFHYTGISAGWVWGYHGSLAQYNEISYNHIHRIGKGLLADLGGIYLLSTSYGTHLANNVIHDIDSYAYGGWGLYTDEGSEGVVMERNLVYNAKTGAFHQHFGQDNLLRNNIFADGVTTVMAATRIETNHCVFRVEGNVIASFRKGCPLMNNRAPEQKTSVWKGNLYYCAESDKCFAGRDFATWGKDKEGVFADPLFIDPKNGDYRLKCDSPAFKLGFASWDYGETGLYGPMRNR